MSKIVFEINTAVWMNEQAWVSREKRDLADIPEEMLREWAAMGIDVVWFLGVWKRGEASRRICLENEGLKSAFERAAPGSVPDHVAGSPFSVADYSLDSRFGDETTLPRLREKMRRHGLKLMLDFVPNHLAVDHVWTQEHPEYFVRGSESELERAPGDYFRVEGHTKRILAHGRDPYFPGWTDTVQINIFRRAAREALTSMLLRVSDQCDMARCDMAMLLLNDVFRQTWGDLSIVDYPDGDVPEFWPKAIAKVKEQHPEFQLAAEVYWDLEGRLQEQGFDYTYDKSLYDKLLTGDGTAVRSLIQAPRAYQERMVRFIENHDERRAAKSLGMRHKAAAALLVGLPGLTLLHEGQFEGRRMHAPVQLDVRMREPEEADLKKFYGRLLAVAKEPVMREGIFRALDVRRAWAENESSHVVVTYGRSLGEEMRLVVANIGEHQAQAYTQVPVEDVAGDVVEFRDLMSEVQYYRSKEEVLRKGLYLDLAGGAFHVFAVGKAPEGKEADRY